MHSCSKSTGLHQEARCDGTPVCVLSMVEKLISVAFTCFGHLKSVPTYLRATRLSINVYKDRLTVAAVAITWYTTCTAVNIMTSLGWLPLDPMFP